MNLLDVLKTAQLVIAGTMIVVILMQSRSAGMGNIFGGGGGGTFKARRGLEAVLFNSTVLLGVLFAINGIAIAILGVRNA